MTKVLKLNENEYVVIQGSFSRHGDLTKTVVVMDSLGIEFEEIEMGLVELSKDNRTEVEYGIRGKFIYAK